MSDDTTKAATSDLATAAKREAMAAEQLTETEREAAAAEQKRLHEMEQRLPEEEKKLIADKHRFALEMAMGDFTNRDAYARVTERLGYMHEARAHSVGARSIVAHGGTAGGGKTAHAAAAANPNRDTKEKP